MKELYNVEIPVDNGNVYTYMEIFQAPISMVIRLTVTVGKYTAEVEYQHLPSTNMVNFNMAMAIEEFVNSGKFDFEKTPARKELKEKLLEEAAEMLIFCGETGELSEADEDFEEADDCFLWRTIRVGNRNAMLVVLDMGDCAAPKVFYGGSLYKLRMRTYKYETIEKTAKISLNLFCVNSSGIDELVSAINEYIWKE